MTRSDRVRLVMIALVVAVVAVVLGSYGGLQ